MGYFRIYTLKRCATVFAMLFFLVACKEVTEELIVIPGATPIPKVDAPKKCTPKACDCMPKEDD